jgi:putative membrane-bound dehydrogenase-like protein
VDVTPQTFPVRVNGMFTERTTSKATDPLTARALALDDGKTQIVLCVVDTCMMPRDLIDSAKRTASAATGIPADRMMVSSTHTHSGVSAMGCLGSREDPAYVAWLPGKIAEAITAAVKNLQPARAGWTGFDDWDHTFNRRWIRRPDRMLTDPFGQTNVRANMHPGYQSPDVTGPSGPVDPQLTVLAVETPDGKPLALWANYSMHYFDSPPLSADYFGRFTVHIGPMIGAGPGFVGMMSQGTSGDLAKMDYGSPAPKDIGYDAYARQIAERVADAYKKIAWKTEVPLAMAESTLTLNYRVPDEKRLQTARETAAKLGDKLPQNIPEVYALEAILLHERQKTELKLQAIRVGDMGITALPNEVYCLTGLKLKARSPFPLTMNVELANGAEGYIPPPEQHALGGYTTWPARTAGLEVQAEPKIVEAVTGLLEKVSGKPRKTPEVPPTAYSKAVIEAKPTAYWRMEEMDAPNVSDAVGKHNAALENGVAVFLPGMGDVPRKTPASRAFHFAGGRMKSTVPLPDAYSVEMWLWNGLPPDARAVTGYAFSRGKDADKDANGEHLGIGGTYRPGDAGRLILFNGNVKDQLLTGKTKLALKAWHHVILVRDGNKVRVHLDGRPAPEIEGELPLTVPAGENSVFFGGRNDNLFNWEGKLDEVAIYPRALTREEISAHYQASSLTPPAETVKAPEFPALSPEESLKKVHVPEGFTVQLAAHEPQTMDPIAIDWDLAGRLWVVEMADYPMGMDGKGKPGGRVRVLEDADGNGHYEKSTLFADGLNFPTGLLTWRDGVIVTAAPDILFLRDTNGDGAADSREVLVSGLQQGNQQLRANGLRWGLDNWVYCAAGGHHGDYGVNTKLRSHRRNEDIAVGSRDFRFRPDTGELEPQSGPSQFGRNRDDAGHWYGTQNSRALWQYVLPDHYLKRNPHVPAPDPSRLLITPLNAPVWPVSPPEKRFHSFENAGHFTSACGGMIYRDDLLFPRAEHTLHALTCEPFHNLVQHNVLTGDGVSFTAHRAAGEEKHDFFASEDRWCRPVMTRTGPDGALWVVDMYRCMIEHPDWLPPNGREELLPLYRLGDDKGRIYRVIPKSKAPRKAAPLQKLSTAELIAALDSLNEWQRDKAHMALVWKLKASPNEKKLTLTENFSRLLESSNPLARLHALCVLDGIDSLPPVLVHVGLTDKNSAVRENALRLAERIHDTAVISAAEELVNDPDAKVRLQLAFSLGAWTAEKDPSYTTAGSALAKLAVKDFADPFMRAAILSSAVPHCRTLCEGIAAAGGPALSSFANELTALALALDDRDSLAAMLRPPLISRDGAYDTGQLQSYLKLEDALAARKTSRATLSTKPDSLTNTLRLVDGMIAFAKQAAADASKTGDLRAAAAAVLYRQPAERAAALQLLTQWLTPVQGNAMQLHAVRTLAATGDDSVPAILLSQHGSLTPVVQTAANEALLSREAWTMELLHHLKSGPLTLDAVQKARVLHHSSKRVRELAASIIKTESSRKQVIEQFRPALSMAGNAARGKTVAATRCIACHRIESAGLEIGPDLKSVVNHPKEKILTNIIDPSLDVQPGFFAYQCKLKDGSDLYGLVTSETGNSVSFKLIDGSTRLLSRRDIAELKSTGQSLMPPGLETGMSPQEMADLLAWLTTPH